MRFLIVVAVAVLLSACTKTVGAPPSVLLTCSAWPKPGVIEKDSDVALYIEQGKAAHSDCYGAVKGIRKFYFGDEQPGS